MFPLFKDFDLSIGLRFLFLKLQVFCLISACAFFPITDVSPINSTIFGFYLMALFFVDYFDDDFGFVLDYLDELLDFAEDIDKGYSFFSFSMIQLQTWCLKESTLSYTSSNLLRLQFCSAFDEL